MEKDLHNEKFWTFITNEKSDHYPIRMELLFDMIEMKPSGESNFYTFNRFYERFKNSDNRYDTWELIERYMQQLKSGIIVLTYSIILDFLLLLAQA